MVQIPTLVQDLPLTRLTNSVLVGTMKFTLDQFGAFFTAQTPVPARLAQQQTDFSAAYGRLNAAYALTRESLITQDISGLDEEGDQLFLAVKETSLAAQRMTYVPARKEAGDRNVVMLKKYRIDTKENMISEWSKIQQLCEEANASAQITADMATLGLTEVMVRLTTIADTLRNKITERSNELPALKAMKQAREAIYPEYRALIQLLNAFALVSDNVQQYATLISTLNGNIDYVRIHAMKDGGETLGGGGSSQPDNGGGENGGGSDPTPSPDPNSGGGDNGGSGGFDTGS
ncbi:MAG: hypothetical protein J5888_00050 [Bacteroidaceae bacterium]|nr:hypothetical protein [Bacteroidaceae bacterium]